MRCRNTSLILETPRFLKKLMDGLSYFFFLKGQTPKNWSDNIYCEAHVYEPTLCTIRMVRTRSWKYIYNPCSEDELYDMQTDPVELHNVANKIGYKHVLRQMKDSIIAETTWQSNSYDLYTSQREKVKL